VHVRQNARASDTPGDTREHVDGEVAVRVRDVDSLSSEQLQQTHECARVEGAGNGDDVSGDAVGSDEVEERAVGWRDDEHVVSSSSRSARELQRDHLPAGDVAADDDVRDPHARGRVQTA
jgi:hypothetical protein